MNENLLASENDVKEIGKHEQGGNGYLCRHLTAKIDPTATAAVAVAAFCSTLLYSTLGIFSLFTSTSCSLQRVRGDNRNSRSILYSLSG